MMLTLQHYLKYGKYIIGLLLISSCTKQESLPGQPPINKISFKGYVLNNTDTVQIKINNEIIKKGTGSITSLDNQLAIMPGKKITYGIYKNGDPTPLITNEIPAQPSSQTVRFYYDGSSITDKVEVTNPVDPKNMGFRVMFRSTFYTDPVDAAFGVYYKPTGSSTYVFEASKIIHNVPTSSFSEFFELPTPPHGAAPESAQYVVYLYKAGTTTLYDARLTSPGTLGTLNAARFVPGQSRMYIITESSVTTTRITLKPTDIAENFR